jgi:hypothetical protein
MRLRPTFLALALMAGGCAWVRGSAHPEPPKPSGPLGWATVETDRAMLDDSGNLRFRLLIGASDGGVVLDRRLVPNTNLDLREVRDCDGGAMPMQHYIFDFFPPRPGPSDWLEIRSFDWFGTEEEIPLFVAEEDGGGIPSCVDAEFVLHLESAANTPRFHVVGSRSTSEPDAGQP